MIKEVIVGKKYRLTAKAISDNMNLTKLCCGINADMMKFLDNKSRKVIEAGIIRIRNYGGNKYLTQDIEFDGIYGTYWSYVLEDFQEDTIDDDLLNKILKGDIV